MSKLKLLHVKFRRRDLDCISNDEAAFLLQIGGLIQEIISLQKFIHMSSHGIRIRVQRMAENAQAMYFYRLLAGSLYEGWELLTKRHNEYKIIMAKYKPNLDTVSKSSLRRLENYFSDPQNSCERIRNKFSYHHDYGEILKILRKWPQNDKLEIYLSELHANCRYTASDMVTNLAMLGTTDMKDLQPKLDFFLSDVGKIAHHFVEAISAYLNLILQDIIRKKNLTGKEISIGRVQSLNKTRLRYFVSP